MDDGFKVEIESTPAEIVVHLSGELDAVTVLVFANEFSGLIVPGDERPVAIDLANLGFIDASGLGILVTAHMTLGAAKRRLEIRNASEFTMRLLRITELDRILHFPEL